MKTIVLLLLLSPTMLWAQGIKITPQDVQRNQSYLLLRDGTVVKGRIIRQDSSLITVSVRHGDLSFIETDQVVTVSANRPDKPIHSLTPYTVFVLKDGSQVAGKFVRRDSTMITVRKRNGQLTYFEPELLVRTDSVLTEAVLDSGRAFSNRFSPWLLSGLTAYNPEKGRFYYRNTWLLLNEFDYGITRNLSVGANFVATIPYLGLVLPDYYAIGNYNSNSARFFSKLSAPIGKSFRAGLNVTYQTSSRSAYYQRGIWTFQALMSVGNSQRNVTVSYGLIDRGKQKIYQYSYSSSSSSIPFITEVRTPNQSFLTLGLMQKIGPNLTLLSDNQIKLGNYYYYFDDNHERVTVSVALRLNRPRHAFDLGVYSLWYSALRPWFDGRQARFLPYLSYNLIIGKK